MCKRSFRDAETSTDTLCLADHCRTTAVAAETQTEQENTDRAAPPQVERILRAESLEPHDVRERARSAAQFVEPSSQTLDATYDAAKILACLPPDEARLRWIPTSSLKALVSASEDAIETAIDGWLDLQVLQFAECVRFADTGTILV